MYYQQFNNLLIRIALAVAASASALHAPAVEYAEAVKAAAISASPSLPKN
jgi:hypothetical protein